MDHDLSIQFFSRINEKGFIPGPEETTKAFLQRIQPYLDKKLDPLLQVTLCNQEVEEILRPFDLKNLNWVPLEYSKNGLLPWQAAVTEVEDQCVQIKLNPRLKERKKIWGVKREEIIAHELLHAARMAFPDGHYEELLVSLSEKSAWRRWLRSLVSRTWEGWALIVGITISLSVMLVALLEPEAFYVAFENLFWAIGLLLMLLSPYLLFLSFGVRQVWRVWRLQGCAFKLRPLLHDESAILALLYRLTDKEIAFFAKSSLSQIAHYVKKEESLRWRVLRCYFSN